MKIRCFRDCFLKDKKHKQCFTKGKLYELNSIDHHVIDDLNSIHYIGEDGSWFNNYFSYFISEYQPKVCKECPIRETTRCTGSHEQCQDTWINLEKYFKKKLKK